MTADTLLAKLDPDDQPEPPELPQFRNRRAFLIWALMIGAVPPQRVVERIVAEVEGEAP